MRYLVLLLMLFCCCNVIGKNIVIPPVVGGVIRASDIDSVLGYTPADACDVNHRGNSLWVTPDSNIITAYELLNTGRTADNNYITLNVYPGVYTLTKSLSLDSNTCLNLLPGAILKAANGLNSAVIINADSTNSNINITIKGGTIWGNSSGQTAPTYGCKFDNTRHLVIDGLTTVDCNTDGIYVDDTNDFTITNFMAIDCGRAAINMGGNARGVISSCRFRDCGYGVYALNSSNITVSGIEWSNGGDEPFAFIVGGIAACRNIAISNCNLHDPCTWNPTGLTYDHAGGTVPLMLSGNNGDFNGIQLGDPIVVYDSAGSGLPDAGDTVKFIDATNHAYIGLTTGGSGDDTTVKAKFYLFGMHMDGVIGLSMSNIQITGFGHGAYLSSVDTNVAITNCIFNNNDLMGSLGSAGGLYLSGANDVTVSNCIANSNGGGSTDGVGFLINGGQRVSVNNCIAKNNKLAGAYVLETGVTNYISLSNCIMGNSEGGTSQYYGLNVVSFEEVDTTLRMSATGCDFSNNTVSTVADVCCIFAYSNCADKEPIAATAAYVIYPSFNGSTFTNTGASTAVQFSLPAAQPGQRYMFYVNATQELRVNPTDVDTVNSAVGGTPAAAGEYITADAVGEFIVIECFIAKKWDVTLINGTWTEETPP